MCIHQYCVEKSEAMYTRAFQELFDVAEEFNVQLRPQYIITDFEKTAINVGLLSCRFYVMSAFCLCRSFRLDPVWNILFYFKNPGLLPFAWVYFSYQKMCCLLFSVCAPNLVAIGWSENGSISKQWRHVKLNKNINKWKELTAYLSIFFCFFLS